MISANVEKLLTKKRRTADEAVHEIRSGDRVYVGSNCGQPIELCRALCLRTELSGVEITHLLTFGPADYVDPKFAENFRVRSLFIAQNTRDAVNEGRADYVPVFLSEVPGLFRSGQLPIDVAMVMVSPPDQYGYCSLGVSVDVGKSACEAARIVIAEINPQMPRTMGVAYIHLDDIDFVVETNYPILEHSGKEIDEVSMQIAHHVSELIDDGATLQTGIGNIPSAVLLSVDDKNDLGVHTEMFSDALLEAIDRGNVTCRKKTLHRDRVISSFIIGTRELYERVDSNPFFEFHGSDYINDPYVIAKNDKMVAINSCLEIDLTGQIVSDSIGSKFYSGIGGQVDFIRGAARSKGGKPIIAVPSTARGGAESRIVLRLKEGAGVVTSRGDVHYVVTEYGTAYLHGRSIRERALSLIRIAHPKFRDALLEQAKDAGLIPKDQPSVDHPYPGHLVREVMLKSRKTVTVRPILPTDDQLLRKHFYSLSPQSVFRRFNRMVKTLTMGAVRDLVNVDYQRHMAIVAVRKDGEAEEILATSRYLLDDTTNRAEISFAILDEWQNKGIGTVLFHELAEYAKSKKVAAFEAYVQPDNFQMLAVFRGSGYQFESTMDEGQLKLVIWLAPPKKTTASEIVEESTV